MYCRSCTLPGPKRSLEVCKAASAVGIAPCIYRVVPRAVNEGADAPAIEQPHPRSAPAPTHGRRRRRAAPRSGRRGGVIADDSDDDDDDDGGGAVATPDASAKLPTALSLEGPGEEQSDSDSEDEPDDGGRSALLLQLASATPETIDVLIQDNSERIDEELLTLLYERIQAAKKFDEGEDIVDGLTLLFVRLRTVLERNLSTPALRLLDDLLLILDSGARETEQARMNVAVARMQRAFAAQRGAGLDVFDVAQALGAGDRDAADVEAVEYVARRDFITDVGRLLKGAGERADRLQLDIEMKEATLKEGIERGIYGEVEQQKFDAWLRQQKSRAAEMATTMRWCDRLLKSATIMEDTDQNLV